MTEVTTQRTPATPDEVEHALRYAWAFRYEEPIRGDVLALLLALSDLETGTWESMYNWNLGNIVPVGGQDYFFLTDRAGNRLRFRPYDSLQEGANELVKQLTRDSRSEWRDGLMSGDPVTFVEALKGHTGGAQYFEADFDRYLNTFLGRHKRYGHLRTTTPKAKAGQGSAQRPPSYSSSEGFTGGYEINVDCMGLPHLAVDIQRPAHTRVAQSMLNLLADPPLKVDGRFGPKTQKATLDYQLEHNLVATGTIDAQTWASLIHTMKETNNGK